MSQVIAKWIVLFGLGIIVLHPYWYGRWTWRGFRPGMREEFRTSPWLRSFFERTGEEDPPGIDGDRLLEQYHRPSAWEVREALFQDGLAEISKGRDLCNTLWSTRGQWAGEAFEHLNFHRQQYLFLRLRHLQLCTKKETVGLSAEGDDYLQAIVDRLNGSEVTALPPLPDLTIGDIRQSPGSGLRIVS